MLEDLKKVPEIKCKLVAVGNSHKTLDSYNWNLSTMLLDMRSRDQNGIFDVVYLDGAHSFMHTGLGICLLKMMMKLNGILILDDLFWSYENSEAAKQAAEKLFPPEQMQARQVLRAQDIFLMHDSNYRQLSHSESKRGIFKRIN